MAVTLLAAPWSWPDKVRADDEVGPNRLPATPPAASAASSASQPDGDRPSASPREPASRMSFTLPAPQSKSHDGKLPMFFEADHLEGETDDYTRATGNVRMRQGGLTVRADEVTHTQATNTARGIGHVVITNNGNIFAGPELTLKLDTMEGEFIRPRFWFARTRAGGTAEHVEFLGNNRLRALDTTYSSCTPENTPDGKPGEPAWSLQTSSIYLDFDANEGKADNAVIWFKGFPILAAPSLTFPLNDERKSGWLPPSFDYDSMSGFEMSAPYYWNIAPNKDMTLAPKMSVRRGWGLDGEYRYLTPHDEGTLQFSTIPDDQLAGYARGLIDFTHKGNLNDGSLLTQTNYDVRLNRVSDDNYWKDFPNGLSSTLTPRLYDSHINFERQLNSRNWGLGDSQTTLYANVQSWQTLRDTDPLADQTVAGIQSPYRREPQLGVRSRSGNDSGFVWSMQSEFNRFTNADPTMPIGNRLDANGQVSYVANIGGINITPRLSLDSTNYDLDQPMPNSGSRSASRTLPTFSLDSGFSLERPLRLFNKDVIQTLEPRIQYVYTPYQNQSNLPLFDSAPRDFNQYSVFNENDFTGGDRINDANHVTMGLTTRMLDQQTGAEAMRLGVVQKVLLSEQRINPDGTDPITQKLSDLLLLGSSTVVPYWNVNSALQLNAQDHAVARGLMGVSYTPGAWRTISVNYTYTRDAISQWDIGWQWPIAGRKPPMVQVRQEAVDDPLNLSGRGKPANSQACGGTWYSVGHTSYSMIDKRLTSALIGFEYDAGCWVGRIVAERTAIGLNQNNTRFMFQLELVGLSRVSLGTNPLATLRDNIPGYTLLHSGKAAPPNTGPVPFTSDD
jgi:LPS-assembly protein